MAGLLRGVVVAALPLAAAACGDDLHHTTADQCVARAPASDDLLDRLRAAPCVASATELASDNAGYRAFDLRFTQLVDHEDPDAGTFEQQATLLARDEAAPMVLVSTGYANYFGQYLTEPAWFVQANQIVVEHRYFADSIPADPDWSQLTIENAAADHHQIVAALRPLFGGAWVSTGASKGGMTSVYHRRFWPEDVDATIPYVAPLSFGAPDDRYDAFVDAVGTPACRQALEDLEVELLTHRRATLEQRAADAAAANGYAYTRIALPVAVESAVTGIYWAFWQYQGVDACDTVPAVTATDDEVWTFLETVSSVEGSDDDSIAFFQAYYYQSLSELGFPGTDDTWLDGLTLYGGADYLGAYPPGVALPAFRPEAMQDVDAWVRGAGADLLFVYGEWDPWTGGAFRLGDARDAALYVVPEGTHGAGIDALPSGDRAAALAMLAAWTGVTPTAAKRAPRAAPPSPPRLPPALRQAWRVRARAR